MLAHPWAVRELLAEQLPVLMDTVALLDSFMEHQRKLGTHAEWPDDTWLNPVQVEVILPSSLLKTHASCGKVPARNVLQCLIDVVEVQLPRAGVGTACCHGPLLVSLKHHYAVCAVAHDTFNDVCQLSSSAA